MLFKNCISAFRNRFPSLHPHYLFSPYFRNVPSLFFFVFPLYLSPPCFFFALLSHTGHSWLRSAEQWDGQWLKWPHQWKDKLNRCKKCNAVLQNWVCCSLQWGSGRNPRKKICDVTSWENFAGRSSQLRDFVEQKCHSVNHLNSLPLGKVRKQITTTHRKNHRFKKELTNAEKVFA